MSHSGASQPDPFILPSIAASLLPPYLDTKPLAQRSFVLNPTKRTLVLISAGQSNTINILPTATLPTNYTVIDNLNIYDGNLYSVSDRPLLGTQDATASTTAGHGGAVTTLVADLLISNNRFDRVILVPIAVSGSDIGSWAVGAYATRINVALAWLQRRGLVAGTPGLSFGFTWMQGQADKSVFATQAYYQARWAILKANMVARGFVGRFFPCVDTRSSPGLDGGGLPLPSTTSAAIQAAQLAICDNITVWTGGNMDQLGDVPYRQDNTHYSDLGGGNAAFIHYTAIRNTGPW